MSSFARLREESNKIGVEFIFTELDAAFTFLQVAETTRSPDVRDRNRGHAREAYETVLRLQPGLLMEPAQKSEFQKKFSALKKRLIQLGLPV